MDQKFENQIISLIDSVDDMTIATVRDDGFPQATTVSYVNDGLDLYFMTAADSQKVKNIAANNKVSLTINSDYQSWDEIEGLSMAALAQPVDDLEEQERIGELGGESVGQPAATSFSEKSAGKASGRCR